MLKYFALTGIIIAAIGHLWCGHLARQTQGYRSWALWDVWRFIISDWQAAKRPFVLMLVGLMIVIACIGLHLLGCGSLRGGFQ